MQQLANDTVNLNQVVDGNFRGFDNNDLKVLENMGQFDEENDMRSVEGVNASK